MPSGPRRAQAGSRLANRIGPIPDNAHAVSSRLTSWAFWFTRPAHPLMFSQINYRPALENIAWPALKGTWAADDFDNGRTPEQLERSFRNSHSACLAYSAD